MRNFKAGAAYFGLVFGAGFVFGVIRQLLLLPRVGAMWAELIEMPFMLVVIIAAARWTVRRFLLPRGLRSRAIVGGVGLALLLGAEISLVIFLRGLTLRQYLESREPVSGVVYLAMLGVFAAMPAFLARSGDVRRGLTTI